MRKRFFKNLPPFAIAASAVLLFFFGGLSSRDGRFEVKKVLDGDTVELMDGRAARYIGIDTPELHRRTQDGWREVNEPFALEAARANEELVLKKPVRLEFDVRKQDKYRRLLVYCFVRGEQEVFVQAELLKRGLAYLYTLPPNVKYVDVLFRAQKEAQALRRGVWSLDLDIVSKDVPRFIGERKRVSGEVKGVCSTPKTIRLSMDGLVVVIFNNDLELFRRQGIDPATAYNGKNIRVFGLIKEYRGEPEIIAGGPWQIEIVGDRAPAR